jgi:hypothetical protein
VDSGTDSGVKDGGGTDSGTVDAAPPPPCASYGQVCTSTAQCCQVAGLNIGCITIGGVLRCEAN